MPLKSKLTIDIPQCSLPTFLFQSPTEPLSTTKRCYLDADEPDKYYFSPAHFRLWCQRFGLGLQKSKHFKKGDRILLFSGNDLFFPVVFLGTLCGGGIFSGANPTYVARELAYQLRDSGATYLLSAEAAIDTAIEAAKMNNMPLERVFVFNKALFDGPNAPGTSAVKGCQHWSKLVAPADEARSFTWDHLRGDAANTTLALNYSSGTTGIPKGVEITHRNYVANTLQFIRQNQLHPEYKAKTERARWLCYLPMYHAMAQGVFVVCGFARQIPVYIMPKFNFVKVLTYVEKYKITDFIMVPPIAVAVAKSPIVKQFDLSSIESLSSGAAPISRDVCAQVEQLFPGKNINMKQSWGMTEVTCAALGWNSTETSLSSSVGELYANCEGMIMSDDGQTEITARGPAHHGELWIRTPNTMKGYWNRPDATRDTLTPDGWLKTGDIAYIDAADKFYIVDRKKELIKVKGHQVAPAELEALLLEHPAVADAAVIGVPTADGDEAPRAYIVRRPPPPDDDDPSRTLAPEALQDFVANNVARHKRLTAGVRWVDAIPKNPSGKILRRRLRERALEEEEEEEEEKEEEARGRGEVESPRL